MVLVWSYAYEYESVSLVSDAVFDAECKLVDKTIDTGRPDLDDWFRREFEPFTGSWIGDFPELEKIRNLYYRWFKKGAK